MPISLITGPANAGKARLVMQALAGHAARGAEPLLVVPTDLDQVRYRRELAESGLGSGARVERFGGLFSRIVRRAGRDETALGPLARERMLAAVAAAHLGGGEPVQPGLAGALAELIAELHAHRISPARLRQAVEQAAIPAMEPMCGLFEAYREALQACGRVDYQLRLVRALDELRRRPALWGGTPVLLYGFDSFTGLQLDAIETLGNVVDAPVTVSLAYEPGRMAFVGRAHAFHELAPLAREHTQLGARADYYEQAARPALHHLERWLLEESAPRVDSLGAVRLIEGTTLRSELELVAAQVKELLDEGMLAEQIAIVHRSPDAVLGLLGEVLDEAGVAHCARVHVAFARTAVGRALVGAMRCALGAGRLGDLLAWLRAPGLLDRPEFADRLEAQALRRGVGDAAGARRLWEAERWPLARLDRLADGARHGPHALLDATLAELDNLFCAPRRRLARVLDREELPEAWALAGATRALQELRELARCAPHLFGSPAELIGVLETLEAPTPVPAHVGCVVVSDPLSLRARRVKALFLCGLQEGAFPAPARPPALFSQEERHKLALAAGLMLDAQGDQLAAERYLLYAICSRPERLLTLSWHASDHDGAPAAPSLFLDDVCDLFGDDLRQAALRPVPLNGAHGADEAQIGPLSDERVLTSLRERAVWSASSIEAWIACPVRWFVERLLRAGDLQADPEPLARGALAHAALRVTLERLREHMGSARVTPATLGQAKRLLRQALEECGHERPLSLAPERLPGARLRLQAELERYLDHAAASPSPLEPTHLELEFGFEDEGLAPLELEAGVRVRGRIDRVDVGEGGQAVIYDYKGRSVPMGARWAQDGAIQVAIYMQAAQQLLGLDPVGGFYQPLAGKDLRARGVLDQDSGLDLDCVRTDRRSHEEIHQTLDRCRVVALDAVAQARAGRLQPRPATCSYNGGGCSYPEICRCTP